MIQHNIAYSLCLTLELLEKKIHIYQISHQQNNYVIQIYNFHELSSLVHMILLSYQLSFEGTWLIGKNRESPISVSCADISP